MSRTDHYVLVTALLIVGIALVLFGALVLLRFPDRPGGKIGWQGMEVSSVGAGLPLIVVGVASVAFAAANRNNSPSTNNSGSDNASALVSSGTPPATPGCLGSVFRGIPANRVKTIEEGATDIEVIPPPQSLSGAFGLRLTDLGKTVGGVAARYFPADQLFKIEAVVDASCRPVADADLQNIDRGGNPRTLQSYDTLRMHLGDRTYDLRLGEGNSDIQVSNLTRVTP